MQFREHSSVILQSLIKTVSLFAAVFWAVYRVPFLIKYLYPPLAAAVIIFTTFRAGFHLASVYRIGTENFGIKTSFFVNAESIFPLTGVTRVAVTVNPLDRLFRTVQVNISSNSRKETNFTVSKGKAENLHDFLYGEEKIIRSVKITNRTLMLYSLVNPQKTVRLVNYLLSFVTAGLLIFVSGTEAFFLVLVYALSLAAAFALNLLYLLVKYYGYTIGFNGKHILIEYGRLVNVKYKIPVQALDGILLKRNPMNIFFKSYAPYLLLSGNIKKRKPFLMCPIIKRRELAELLMYAKIDISDSKIKYKATQNMSYLYLRPLLPLGAAMLILLPILFVASTFLGLLALILLAIAAIDRATAYKTTYYAESTSIISAKKGGLLSSRVFYRKSSLQAEGRISSLFLEKKGYFRLKLFLRHHSPFTTGYMKEAE